MIMKQPLRSFHLPFNMELFADYDFQVVNEARDFILQSDSETKHSSGVHVFSPVSKLRYLIVTLIHL